MKANRSDKSARRAGTTTGPAATVNPRLARRNRSTTAIVLLPVLLGAMWSLADPPDGPPASDTPGVPSPVPPNVPIGPSSPGLPDIDTPGPGAIPAAIPPAAGAVGDTDIDLLRQTAGELGIAPPDARLDQRLLNWFGVRPYLADNGLTFAFSVTADYSKNLRGGADTGDDVFRHLFNARVALATDNLGLPGGTVSVDFQNESGRNGSDLYGDLQGFDNIDADGRTQISELWYEQWLGNVLRLKVGKVDVNTEFAAPQYGSEFLNSSFGYSPTITGLPTYPDPALSVNAFWYPTSWLSVGYGVYDDGDGHPTGDRPPYTPFRGDMGTFQIAEADVRWTLQGRTLPGRFALGVSYGDGRLPRFRGGEQNGEFSGYLIAEQKLFHYNFYNKSDPRGVYAFVQLGTADEEVTDVHDHVGMGVTWVGPYQATNLDSLGVGVTCAVLSDARESPYADGAETSVEAYYNFQATTYLSVKPDIQYVVNPGGDRTLRDALVATVRVTVAF